MTIRAAGAYAGAGLIMYAVQIFRVRIIHVTAGTELLGVGLFQAVVKTDPGQNTADKG
ncbi:hypothetical protein HMPREF9996_01000 [Aggregatibacter actinomycetemcomitans Y4]|nr:hypothetical protein HMPREF9996_01000 [Aggregatibacter actinomycetemcomitans Y4]